LKSEAEELAEKIKKDIQAELNLPQKRNFSQLEVDNYTINNPVRKIFQNNSNQRVVTLKQDPLTLQDFDPFQNGRIAQIVDNPLATAQRTNFSDASSRPNQINQQLQAKPTQYEQQIPSYQLPFYQAQPYPHQYSHDNYQSFSYQQPPFPINQMPFMQPTQYIPIQSLIPMPRTNSNVEEKVIQEPSTNEESRNNGSKTRGRGGRREKENE